MIRKFFLLVNGVVVISTLLAYLAPYVHPKTTWILAFFGLFYPVLLLANGLFILLWLLFKPRFAILSVVCLLAGWSVFSRFIAFNQDGVDSSEHALTVLSYNISNGLYGYAAKKNDREEKRAAFIEFLKDFDTTDILCLQEVREYGYDIIRKTYPDYFFHYTGKGAVILSKYPFINKGEIDFGTITNSCLWADVNVGFDTIRVYSFHLQSNQISKDAEKISNQTDIDEKQAWYDVKGMLRKFKNRHLTRSKQAEKIAAHARKSTHPVLLGGDMNDPPQSYTYQVLSSLGNDAFRQRGFGLGTTYAGIIPLLRIDYIFADAPFSVVDFTIHNKAFSDHFAISTRIEWLEPKNESQ